LSNNKVLNLCQGYSFSYNLYLYKLNIGDFLAIVIF
jgi:hypothetical protein